LGPAGVLTGSSRVAHQAKEQAQASLREQDVSLKRAELERKREAMEAQIAVTRAAFESEAAELLQSIKENEERERLVERGRHEIAIGRSARRSRSFGNGMTNKGGSS
jgi:circadian clock protein KaiC